MVFKKLFSSIFQPQTATTTYQFRELNFLLNILYYFLYKLFISNYYYIFI